MYFAFSLIPATLAVVLAYFILFSSSKTEGAVKKRLDDAVHALRRVLLTSKVNDTAPARGTVSISSLVSSKGLKRTTRQGRHERLHTRFFC